MKLKLVTRAGIAAHVCHPHIQEGEARGSEECLPPNQKALGAFPSAAENPRKPSVAVPGSFLQSQRGKEEGFQKFKVILDYRESSRPVLPTQNLCLKI